MSTGTLHCEMMEEGAYLRRGLFALDAQQILRDGELTGVDCDYNGLVTAL